MPKLEAQKSTLFSGTSPVLPSMGAYPSPLPEGLKVHAWKGRNRGFEPVSGIQVSKKQNVPPPPQICFSSYLQKRHQSVKIKNTVR